MTFYVGVDIAKYEHVASILDSTTGEFLVDSLHFDNNLKGFNLLLSNLCELNKKDVVIGFESTAHYHQTLFSYLSGKKYKCFLINPFMTSRFRSISLRNAKNDNIDSRAIASFLSFEYRNLIEDDFFLNELKELSIQRDSLLKRSSSLKTQAGIHSKAVRAILKECPTAGDISSTRIDHLQKLAKDASNNRYSSAKVLAIKEAARTSVGFPSEALGLKIRQTILMLEELKKQIDEVNQAICSSPTVIDSPLHKIKGISSIEIAYIMSAIININRFDSPDKLIAYAGLDPIVKQSGTWQAKSTKMSKRGNRLLRFALIWAANNVRKHPSKMKDYYGKKISEGKSHYNALGHCAAKLCRYIFFVLNHPNQDFIN